MAGPSHRERLVRAILDAVADKGYEKTTVADIVARARVSRRTFYEHFKDKADAFLAAYDDGVKRLLDRLDEASAATAAADWREAVRAELRAYLEVLEGDPSLAWCLHVEVLAAGRTALRRRVATIAAFSERMLELYERGREEERLPVLPGDVFDIHAGGLDELLRAHLRREGAKDLHKLAEPLALATLAMFDRG